MNSTIQTEIERLVSSRPQETGTEAIWRRPLVGFASASDALFIELKTAVGATHAMPRDLLDGAETVIAFFIPFEKSVSVSNKQGRDASEGWARAYIETNRLIHEISQYVAALLEGQGFPTRTIPATHNFDEKKLISDWSHRHVAFIAGLGRFGLNNMLITESGCCGRVGSIVTSARIEPDERPKKEACLYKHDGTCGRCAERCVNDALRTDGFDRHRCYQMCLLNESRLEALGKADVCGKCVVAIPCAHINPAEIKRSAKKANPPHAS